MSILTPAEIAELQKDSGSFFSHPNRLQVRDLLDTVTSMQRELTALRAQVDAKEDAAWREGFAWSVHDSIDTPAINPHSGALARHNAARDINIKKSLRELAGRMKHVQRTIWRQEGYADICVPECFRCELESILDGRK